MRLVRLYDRSLKFPIWRRLGQRERELRQKEEMALERLFEDTKDR